MPTLVHRRPAAAASLLAALLASAGLPAAAAVFGVTKTADTADGVCDADCSLREAVIAANTTPGDDEVRLRHAYYRLTLRDDPAVAQERPQEGDLDIGSEDSLKIRGLSTGSVIDADHFSRVIEVKAPAQYEDPVETVELLDLELRNGAAPAFGGGILNAGTLTLRRVRVLRNRVTLVGVDGTLSGGGIDNRGELRLIASTVAQNLAFQDSAPGRGGGIVNHGVLYMLDSAVRDNRSGTSEAQVSGLGAGLYNVGRARIDRSFFGGNDAGSGEGSAISNLIGATLAVFSSTLSNNGSARSHHALANGTRYGSTPAASLTLGNVTLANNNGGGLFNTGKVFARRSLIAGNYTQADGTRNDAAAVNCENRPEGRMSVVDHLLGGDGSDCPAQIVVDNASVFSAVLRHLRYLGGPTPVHALQPGSPALDASTDSACSGLDQRAAVRPADGDGDGVALCDLGAFERQPGED